MRRDRLNPGLVATALVALLVLAACTSTTATASQSQSRLAKTSAASTTTTTLGTVPPALVNGLRVTPMLPPAGIFAVPTPWLRVERPDGATQLVAVYRPEAPGPHPVVVYLHGSSGLNEPELAWARGLAQRGYIVVAGCYLDADPGVYKPTPHYWISCPGLPQGEPAHPTLARPAYEALLDVAIALPDAQPGGVGVVGVSHGAIEALSTNDPRVRVIVADSGYGKAGVDVVTAPVLMLGMTNDPNVMHSRVQGFEWMLAAAGKTVASQYYRGTGHVATIAAPPMAALDATNRAEAWLHRTLG